MIYFDVHTQKSAGPHQQKNSKRNHKMAKETKLINSFDWDGYPSIQLGVN